jgi:uncharacterized repeat protein (TIGR01451 family)
MKTCNPGGIFASLAAGMKSGVSLRGMKVFLQTRMPVLLAAGLMAAGPRAGAQLGLSVTSSASSILVSNPVTYTISVTNLTTGFVPVFVTNTFPATARLLGASFTLGTGNTFTNANGFSFTTTLASGAPAQMTVRAAPTEAGFFTNTVSVFASGLTNFTTNMVAQVTNAPAPQADLGAAITGPIQAVITNDWMTYEVTATNSGPNAASSVALTNALPPGVGLKGVSPTNQGFLTAGSNLIFTLGTLTNGGHANLQFTVQPTNAGVLTFSASIGAPGVLDTNLANNSASANITVTNYLSGLLVAVTNSAQGYNPQNGLVEQSIAVTNADTNDVPAVRVVVTGLTNHLFNAVGTNNGAPFVVYNAALNTNQSVNLLLQYSAGAYFPLTNGQLHAFAVPVSDWSPPIATTTSTNLNLTRIVRLFNGNMLIEWPAVTNRTYTVVYSDNVLFSNAMMAPPSVVAPANEAQWIDYGPPTTVSAPTNASSRFYRVFLNP